MKKGSHIEKSKKSLNNADRELLDYLLDSVEQGYSFTATSLDVDEMLKNTDLTRDKKWTHHNTTEALSNLVEMDLLEELVGYFSEEDKTGQMKVNNMTPVYTIEFDSVIHRRAVYARDRDNSSGITLFHLIRGDEEFGEELWPNRPTDRVKLVGSVDKDGILVLRYNRKELIDMAGKEVSVIIQS